MRLKGLIITVVVLVALVFSVLNWQSLTAPLPVNLLFVRFETPLALWTMVLVLVISAVFFLISLFERGGQLRQISHLERQLERSQAKLDKKRLEELAGLEQRLNERLNGVEQRVERTSEVTQNRLEEHREALVSGWGEGAGRLEERVLVLRNELAADIHEAEDAIRSEINSAPRALPQSEETKKA